MKSMTVMMSMIRAWTLQYYRRYFSVIKRYGTKFSTSGKEKFYYEKFSFLSFFKTSFCR
ncbi:unnamed protein product [Meloidogyne enterolobii]|uniref:Uncharacterized protein n=1 Tax=Meloidogyne enterolobii TaxID=390850 RepID=A0ACB0ZLE1_MELEN